MTYKVISPETPIEMLSSQIEIDVGHSRSRHMNLNNSAENF